MAVPLFLPFVPSSVLPYYALLFFLSLDPACLWFVPASSFHQHHRKATTIAGARAFSLRPSLLPPSFPPTSAYEEGMLCAVPAESAKEEEERRGRAEEGRGRTHAPLWWDVRSHNGGKLAGRTENRERQRIPSPLFPSHFHLHFGVKLCLSLIWRWKMMPASRASFSIPPFNGRLVVGFWTPTHPSILFPRRFIIRPSSSSLLVNEAGC